MWPRNAADLMMNRTQGGARRQSRRLTLGWHRWPFQGREAGSHSSSLPGYRRPCVGGAITGELQACLQPSPGYRRPRAGGAITGVLQACLQPSPGYRRPRAGGAITGVLQACLQPSPGYRRPRAGGAITGVLPELPPHQGVIAILSAHCIGSKRRRRPVDAPRATSGSEQRTRRNVPIFGASYLYLSVLMASPRRR